MWSAIFLNEKKLVSISIFHFCKGRNILIIDKRNSLKVLKPNENIFQQFCTEALKHFSFVLFVARDSLVM